MRVLGLVAAVLICGLTTSCAVDTIESDEAGARLDYELDRAASNQRAAEGSARLRAREAEASASALSAQQAARSARLASQRLSAPAPYDTQQHFQIGWSKGCESATAVPRRSGEWVTYEDCMALVEVTDLPLGPDEAQRFGKFMAEQAMIEQFGN